MTHALGASRPLAPASPTSRPAARWTAAGGVLAGPLFLAAGLAQGSAREGFDFTRHAISQLALGGAGWIQTVNFLIAGALLVAGAAGRPGRRRARGGRPAWCGPAAARC